MVRYPMNNRSDPDMSMLEMLDVLNEELTMKGEEPVAFEHDCREGICGSCGFMINGVAHGPLPATTVCQLTLRHFKDGDEVVSGAVARSKAFPIMKDLVVDRRAFDRIIAAGGYFRVPTGSAPDGNTIPVAQRRRRPRRWTRPPASAAELVSPRVPTLRRRCSPALKSPISDYCRKVSRSGTSARSTWSPR